MWSEILRDDGHTDRTYLERLGAINAPHTDSRHFAVFAKESFELSLKFRNLFTETFLQSELAAGSSDAT